MKRPLLLLLCVLCLVPACSGKKGDVTEPVPTTSYSPLRTEAGVVGQLFAHATKSSEVDPNFESGEDIFITDDGFKPRQLIARVNAEIWVHNETSDTQSLDFVNGTYRASDIAPGKIKKFRASSLGSYAYTLAGEKQTRGSIHVEPPAPEDATPAPS